MRASAAECEDPRTQTASSLYAQIVVAVLIWTATLLVLLAWSVSEEYRHAEAISAFQARALFEEIVTTRRWNALHGGVYVFAGPAAPPNPNLGNPDRDVTTRDGRTLTKINPAYMTRQIGELAAGQNLAWFHITSNKPIRPGNAPKPWEAELLRSFRGGVRESFSFASTKDAKPVFRYMAPLWVEKSCLRCHAKQGYVVGDLRGGISVTLAAGPILAARDLKLRHLALAYCTIWLVGLVGLFGAKRRLAAEARQREDLIAKLQDALGTVKTLEGILPICASCKMIRDEEGSWHAVESYIDSRSEVQFSHGICPDCVQRLYGKDFGEDPKA